MFVAQTVARIKPEHVILDGCSQNIKKKISSESYRKEKNYSVFSKFSKIYGTNLKN